MSYNNELLRELHEKAKRKKHLEGVLSELRAKIRELEPQVRKLEHMKYLEQSDVDKLEKGGVRAFFLNLTGKREERMEKERQEAYEVRAKYESASFELNTLKADLQKYIDEFSKLKYIDAEYEKMLKEKAELVLQKGGVHQKLNDLEQRAEQLMAENNELRKARAAASSAEASARQAISALEKAANLSKWDVAGFDTDMKGNVDRQKYVHLKEAEGHIYQLEADLTKLERELYGTAISFETNLKMGTLARTADRFFDDIFSNITALNKTNKAKEQVENTLAQIEEVLGKLRLQSEEIEAKQAKIKAERDELVINAGL